MAWILRFIHNSRDKTNFRKGELSVKELDEAERVLMKRVVKTKLTDRKDTDLFRYPYPLPNKHKFVEVLIRENHLELMHTGLQTVLSNLREKFWVLGGRRSVRHVINKCRRHTVKPVETAPISLPEDRDKDASVFEIVGEDLAGPLILKGGQKNWLVLFTCAVFRAVHLELASSLSTKDFLLCLRRFVARRGRPSVIYSDNGTNFVEAENLFRSIHWSVVESETTVKRIVWKFIPPFAAWWGGFWERVVQMVKKLLRRVLGNASLNYEELMSLLCECEAVINSRPLSYLSEDREDLMPLTPAMFLQEIRSVGVSDIDQIDLKKRWRFQQALRLQLKKRFRIEYLGLLKQSKERPNCFQLSIGDIVIIENDSKKRTLWPLAKVMEVYPGKDGKVRVVKLKTSSGELLKPEMIIEYYRRIL
ncbi:uncharacterized protein [Parasteatoda tepidariorum]|uniref:uncharacterized protein n=1 Tax=Parasteatoda tepidariorum TaxID=114398 RepID=UPI0039BD0048